MVRGLRLAFLLIAAATLYADEPKPSFTLLPDKSVGIVLPASTLTSDSVRRQLSTGLTTTFLVSARGDGVKGAARVEVRYDLWDEVWIVRRIEFDRHVDRQRLASRQALDQWWRIPVRLFTTPAERTTLDVELAVLPFSAAEEEDARDWLSKSGGVSASGAGFVDVLIGTTITAKPLITYRWRIDLSLR